MKVLITGASGFVGQHIINDLESVSSLDLVKLSRSEKPGFVKSPRLTQLSDWTHLLEGVHTVIHLAGRAHIRDDKENNTSLFIEQNCNATLNLAKQCIDFGVRKFIFFSSIGVHAGLANTQVISSDTDFEPMDVYAESKVCAEIGLNELFKNQDSELIILRPPLIFASDAPGNFRTLLSIAHKRLPLPFASIDNRRSLLSISNLTSLIKNLVLNTTDLRGSYVISDDQVVSTREMISALSEGMGVKSRVFSFSPSLLRKAAKLIGKHKVLEKVCGDFEIDNSRIKLVSGWDATYETKKELIKSGNRFIEK